MLKAAFDIYLLMKQLDHKKKVINTKAIHEGKLLDKLRTHLNMNHKQFATFLQITYEWEYQVLKKASVGQKIKSRINKALGLSQDFWSDPDYALPNQLQFSSVLNDPEGKYIPADEYEKLKAEIESKDKKIFELQEQLIRLYSEISRYKS